MLDRLVSPKKASIVILSVLIVLYAVGKASSKEKGTERLEVKQVETLMDVASSDQYNEVVNNLVAENNDLRERLNDIQLHLKETLPDIQQKLNSPVVEPQGLTEHQVARIIEEKLAGQAQYVAQNNLHDSEYLINGYIPDTDSTEEEITWVQDLQSAPSDNAMLPKFSNYRPEANPSADEDTKEPVYTIPENATLMNSVTLTALIGRVPVRGKITDPYPFKIMVGKENLASNGIEIPGVTGIVASGKATGDLQLSCVRGDIHSMTFTFDDGRIVTKSVSEHEKLGYLSTPSGNPCITGRLYTNADKHLATDITLATVEGAADAFSAAETTATVTDEGTGIEAVTGSVSRFMLGRGVGSASKTTREWYEARRQDSFDAIYVPINRAVSVHITNAIEIDYDRKGRKVSYGSHKTSKTIATHLD